MGDAAVDVAILGGGPAGLTAGIYTARARVSCVVFEKGLPGGSPMLTDLIENYPGFPDGVSGAELSANIQAQAESFGLEVKTLAAVEKVNAAEGAFAVQTSDMSLSAKTVIVATGAHPRRLDIPGEAEFTGRGVSYCATCDGALFRDKVILVVGGGDAAMEEALFLTRFGRKVIVVHRRDELRAAKILQERAFANERIEFEWCCHATKIEGDEVVRKVELTHAETGETKYMDVDGVFIYVGTLPNTDVVAGLVDLDERGFVLTDDRLATSVPGVFACGDVRASHLRQVATAVGDGALAAVSAQKHLNELAG